MARIISILLFTILTISCSNLNKGSINKKASEPNNSTLANTNELKPQNSNNIKNQITTFLTFQKEDAEQAMNFYISLFENSAIDTIKRWGKESPGKEGTIMHATFTLNGKPFMCSDSPQVHDWDFTPAISNYIDCEDVSEIERLFSRLSENGKVMMPLDNYGFSQKFGFVADKFGVSWQLNLQ